MCVQHYRHWSLVSISSNCVRLVRLISIKHHLTWLNSIYRKFPSFFNTIYYTIWAQGLCDCQETREIEKIIRICLLLFGVNALEHPYSFLLKTHQNDLKSLRFLREPIRNSAVFEMGAESFFVWFLLQMNQGIYIFPLGAVDLLHHEIVKN